MQIGYSPEHERLSCELRAYYDELLDAVTVAELSRDGSLGPTGRRLWKQMCADGWAGIGWPAEYGGQGRGPIEQFIFFDESMRAGAPVPLLTLNTVGPTLMRHGSEEQRRHFLPRILAGDVHFCIGYSEPNAGTDLAALQTRAVRDGDEFVITGQKMWTSLAERADYCWLAVRTDPDASRHRGISVLIVPMDSPGISISPLRLMGDNDIAAVYYDQVRVPVENLVGELHGGWSLITSQLNHERVTLCSSGLPERHYRDVLEWARTTRRGAGRRVIDEPWVQHNLARVHAGIEVLRLMNWKIAWAAEHAELAPADASSLKVYGTEFYLDAYRLLMEILGPAAYLTGGSPGAVLAGRLETAFRSAVILTFGGGTNELQRDLVSMFGLGFPRAAR